MTFLYQIDPAQRVLFVRAQGVIQPGDLFGLMRAVDTTLTALTLVESGIALNYLGDYCAADWRRYRKAALFGLSYFFERLSAPQEPPRDCLIRQAIVASSNNLAHVRELHGAPALVGNRQRRYFVECASARQWLGLPAEWHPLGQLLLGDDPQSDDLATDRLPVSVPARSL